MLKGITKREFGKINFEREFGKLLRQSNAYEPVKIVEKVFLGKEVRIAQIGQKIEFLKEKLRYLSHLKDPRNLIEDNPRDGFIEVTKKLVENSQEDSDVIESRQNLQRVVKEIKGKIVRLNALKRHTKKANVKGIGIIVMSTKSSRNKIISSFKRMKSNQSKLCCFTRSTSKSKKRSKNRLWRFEIDEAFEPRNVNWKNLGVTWMKKCWITILVYILSIFFSLLLKMFIIQKIRRALETTTKKSPSSKTHTKSDLISFIHSSNFIAFINFLIIEVIQIFGKKVIQIVSGMNSYFTKKGNIVSKAFWLGLLKYYLMPKMDIFYLVRPVSSQEQGLLRYEAGIDADPSRPYNSIFED